MHTEAVVLLTCHGDVERIKQYTGVRKKNRYLTTLPTRSQFLPQLFLCNHEKVRLLETLIAVAQMYD